MGEVVGEVLERLGPHPDLALVFVTGGHAGAMEDIGASIRALLEPTVLLGVAAGAVVGPGVDVDPGPAVALWAGLVGPVTPLLLTGHDPAPAPTFVPSGALLLGDVASPPAVGWTSAVAGLPGLPVAGGRSSRAGLMLQGRLVTAVTVGALVGSGVRLRTVVSEGARPIGDALTVTRAEREVVYELDGRPAFERLLELVADRMPAEDVRLVNSGLRASVATGDWPPPGPARPTLAVLGVDRSNGALGLDGVVVAGSTIRFEVRDPQAAAAALANGLQRSIDGGSPGGALLFRSEQRDAGWFEGGDPDFAIVGSALGDTPLAGCATTSEVGPVIGGPGPWKQSVSVAVFDQVDRR